MGIFSLSTTFLLCVNWSTIFPPGSAISAKKALNIGDDITLDCVTNWNPNITLYWIQRTVGSLQNRYIATAGPQHENGFIWQRFRDDSCFSYSYENVSSSEMKIALALNISNIAKKDSANYTCVSYQKGSIEPNLLYTYDVRAIDCNCSLESNVVCDLFGLHFSDSLPVSIIVDGSNVTGMVNHSRFELSSRLLNESTHHHSIELSSSDGILSNISCTLPIESSQSSTQTMSTFFPTKIPQSSTNTATMFFPTHSNPSSLQKTTSAFPPQPKPSSTQKTTSVFPSQPKPSSTQTTTTIFPSQPYPPPTRNRALVFPSQAKPSSTQNTTSAFPSQPNPPPTRNRALVFPSQAKPSSTQKTTVFPSQPKPLSTQKTITVFSTQPDPSPDTSSEDSTSLFPNTTPPPFWQPSTPTAVGSQMEDSTSEPNTTTQALVYTIQVQHGITNYDSGSSRKITIAFSIIIIMALYSCDISRSGGD